MRVEMPINLSEDGAANMEEKNAEEESDAKGEIARVADVERGNWASFSVLFCYSISLYFHLSPFISLSLSLYFYLSLSVSVNLQTTTNRDKSKLIVCYVYFLSQKI